VKSLAILLLSTVVCVAQLNLFNAAYPPLFKAPAAAVPSVPPVAGYVLWVHADDPTSMFADVAGTVPTVAGTANGFVAKWVDRSVPATNSVYMDAPLSQERRPALSNNWINGLPALNFGDPIVTPEQRTWLQTATNNVTIGTTGTTVYVVSSYNPPAIYQNFAGLYAEGGFWELRRTNSSATSTATNIEIAGTSVGVGFRANVAYVWTAKLGNNSAAFNNIRLYRNGQILSSNSLAVATFPTRVAVLIGKRIAYPTVEDDCWHGFIAEVIAYPWFQSEAESASVNNYLTNKYQCVTP